MRKTCLSVCLDGWLAVFLPAYSLLLYQCSGTLHRRINIHPSPPPTPPPPPPSPPQGGRGKPLPPFWGERGGGGRDYIVGRRTATWSKHVLQQQQQQQQQEEEGAGRPAGKIRNGHSVCMCRFRKTQGLVLSETGPTCEKHGCTRVTL